MPPEAARRPPAWLLPPACLFLWALQIHAFHWGVITPDTVSQYGQALTGRYDDWHPPIMAWLWRQLIRFWPGSAPMLLLDCTFYWLGLALIAEGLRRSGRPRASLVVILIGALPIPFGQMGSILKDSLLAACLVLALGIMAFRMLPVLPWTRPWRAACALLLVFAAASRFNGVFAAASLLALCLAPSQWEANWRRAAAATIAAAIALSAATVLINHVLLQPERTRPMLSLINFDLAGITVRSGRNVYPASARPPAPLLARCYSPAMMNPSYVDTACDRLEDRLGAATAPRRLSAIALWLNAIRAEPVAYLRHRAAHFNANQRWLTPRVPDDAIYTMSEPNSLGLAFVPNRTTERIYTAASVMAQSPLGRPATWLAVAAALLIAAGVRADPLAGALAASALLYGSAYAAVSVAPDLRYNLWTMAGAMLALLFALPWLRPAQTGRVRLAFALGLVALVVLGECIAVAQA